MHQDGIAEGERVLIVDDLIATGGTAQATAKLVESLKGDGGRAGVHRRAHFPGRPREARRLRSRVADQVLTGAAVSLIIHGSRSGCSSGG